MSSSHAGSKARIFDGSLRYKTKTHHPNQLREIFQRGQIDANLRDRQVFPQSLLSGLSPLGFLLCQVSVAVGVLLGSIGEPCFDRVLNDIFAMLPEALSITDPDLGKSTLPDLCLISEFPAETVGEPTLDQLHGFFDGHVARQRHQQVQMIWQDDEVMELKFTCRYLQSQHVDEKHCIPFGLQ